MPCCLEAQALTPPAVKPYPVCCRPRGVLIRRIGKQRLSLGVLQLCVTLEITKAKDSHSEPLQSLLSPTGSVANELSIRVRLLEGANVILLDLKVAEEDGKGFSHEGQSDHEGLGSEPKPLILAPGVAG